MSDDATISRRSVLVAGCAGAVVCGAALAGCGGSDNGSGTPASTTPGNTGTTAGGTTAPATTAGGTTGATSSGPAANALAKLSDIPSGGSLQVMADGKPVILFRNGNTVTGHSAICTHMGTVIPGGPAELTCPNHGSMFNAQTGAVLKGPASSPLPEVKVSVSGDSVVAG